MLNTITCNPQGGGNTGFGDCYLNPGIILGAFLVPKDLALTAADVLTSASLIAKLQELTIAPVATRIYPIGDFQVLTDSSEAPTYATLGYGGISKTKDGNYDWSFQYFKGGLCLNKELRKFNGKSKSVIFWDDKGQVFGYRVGDTFKGMPLELFDTMPLKIADGTNPTTYLVKFNFKPMYLNDAPAFAESTVGELETVVGLENVALSSGGARVTNVSKVIAKVGCSGTNMADLYATELAVPAAWVVRALSGNLLTITGVAYDANYGGFTITVDAADPDYNASQAVVISLASASVLDGLAVSGYESNTHTTPN